MIELSLKHCGLTLERISELHLLQFSLINPAVEIIDKCMGPQWRSSKIYLDDLDRPFLFDVNPPETLFHLIIYGELFGPDMDTYLDQNSQANVLEVDTRIEFVDGCLSRNSHLVLKRLIESPWWKALQKEMRALAGPDFREDFSGRIRLGSLE